MKTEVACTACGSAYLVDRDMLDDSGTVPCPACGQAMLRVLRQPRREVDAAPVRTPGGPTRTETDRAAAEPARVAAAAPAATKLAVARAVARVPEAPPEVPAPTPAPTSRADDREVVCPRCGLHFQPRRGHAQIPRKGRKTLLVVESNPYFIEIAREALGEWFQVRTARGLDEAWSTLSAGGIDLLVVDLALGSGEEGRVLLERFQVKPCPILIFTARDESEMYGEEWEELRRLGADDMVLKGMNAGETLLRKACELLDVSIDEGHV